MLRTTLRPDQREATNKALAYPGFALFPEQRTGKTLISLAVVDIRKPDLLVIICPKKAIRVWREQIKEHIDFDWKCQKVIVHYEGICRDAKDRRWFRKQFREKWAGKKIFIIVDEGHRIKNRGSLQSRMIRSLAPYATWRLLLTGTPISQGREDAWAIFQFVMPGAFGEDWDEFSDTYLRWGGYKKQNVVGYRNVKRFDRIFHRYSFRVTLRESQKRSGRGSYRVRRKRVRFDLKPDSRRIYNELLTELKTEVRRKKISTPLVMTLIAKLQQLTGGYLIHSEPVRDAEGFPVLTPRGKPKVIKSIIPIGREKIVELLKLIKTFPRRKKLVICVQYRHEIDRIGRQLERIGRSWKALAGKEYFDGLFDTDCIIMQIRSGEAVDLSEADTFIMYSWDFSYVSHEQAKFRILKFGSWQVSYFYLMANDSVDEHIYEAVTKKQNLARLVVDRYRQGRKSEGVKSTRRDSGRAEKALATAKSYFKPKKGETQNGEESKARRRRRARRRRARRRRGSLQKVEEVQERQGQGEGQVQVEVGRRRWIRFHPNSRRRGRDRAAVGTRQAS